MYILETIIYAFQIKNDTNRGKNASQPDERIAKLLLIYQDLYNTINFKIFFTS